MSTEMQLSYGEQLRDPRWQRRRLEIMQRADFKCEKCSRADVTLNIHHKVYRVGRSPWEYADNELHCLCEDCHLMLHLLEEATSKDNDERLEEAIQGAYIVLIQTTNFDTRASAARVMANLVSCRSPARIERMERERGLRAP